ncbi:MAG: hypothetical protein WC734_05595 [Patescibacteria group bacterium]|jgi:hypothetical protein
MTDQQAKRPAHEVILQRLKERIEELECMGGTESRTYNYFSSLGAISVLLDVLRDMAIPENERESVLAELHLTADQWELSINSPNMPQELYNALSSEQ